MTGVGRWEIRETPRWKREFAGVARGLGRAPGEPARGEAWQSLWSTARAESARAERRPGAKDGEQGVYALPPVVPSPIDPLLRLGGGDEAQGAARALVCALHQGVLPQQLERAAGGPRLVLTVRIEGNEVSVEAWCQTPELYDALERGRDALARLLAEEGLKLRDLRRREEPVSEGAPGEVGDAQLKGFVPLRSYVEVIV